MSSRLSVKSLVAGFESLSCESIFINMGLQEELDPLVRSRAGFKSHVTRDINFLKTSKADNTLNAVLFKRLEYSVSKSIQEIERKDIEISAVYDKYKVDLADANRKSDSDATATYILKAHQEMAALETDIASSAVGAAGNAGGSDAPVSNQDLLRAVSQVGSNPIKVSLDCGVFYGDEKDKFEFHAWLSLFETIIKTRPNSSEEFKISYLKSKVQGNAAAFIAHLDIVHGNYQPCIDALKAQYLDEPFLIDEYFKQILNDAPLYDEEYGKTSQYLAKIRNKLHNLKTHYKVDLVTANTGGNKLLSHIVFSKLSGELRKALIAETKSNYPTFEEIMANTSKVINTLIRTRKKKTISKPSNEKRGGGASGSSGVPTLNFSTGVNNNEVFHCRFCQTDGHSSLYCPKYNTYKDRVDRCKQIKICIHCTSVYHPIGSCPGLKNELKRGCKYCNSRTHVTCLCPQGRFISFAKRLDNHVCLSTDVGNKSNYLLPVLSLKMRVHGGPLVRFNVLFDTASSRSYIDPIIAKRLGLKSDSVSEVKYEVRTFLGSGYKSLGEASLEVYLPSQRHLVLPLLIDREFNVSMEIKGLKEFVENF